MVVKNVRSISCDSYIKNKNIFNRGKKDKITMKDNLSNYFPIVLV